MTIETVVENDRGLSLVVILRGRHRVEYASGYGPEGLAEARAAAQARIDELLAQDLLLDRVVTFLRSIEDTGEYGCPVCGGPVHEKDCELRALLDACSHR